MNANSEIVAARSVRMAEARSFTAHDGTRLFFRHWSAAPPTPPRGAILLLHRGHEHGERMAHLVDELGLDGFAFYALDARGHGRSGGPRGGAPDFADLVRDLDRFVRYIAEADGVALADIALVAQSVGAAVAAAWVHDHAPPIRAMVLAAPAFDINLYVPLARPALAAWHRLRGDFRVNSYVRPQMLTRDAGRAASYRADPLISRAVSARVLLGLYETSERIVDDAGAITVPTQLLIPGADAVVKAAAQHRFFENLGAPVKERHVLPGLYHDALGERDRAPVLGEVRRFVTDCFDRPGPAPSLLGADLAGHTRDEFDRLSAPLPGWSARGLGWRLLRGATAIGGRLSRGLALGRATGFDSGATLDYVYRNRPEGAGPIGRLIDRAYLQSVGWRGIRQRKRHIEELLGLALGRLSAEGTPRRIVDVAAGHGRYVLDVLAEAPDCADGILLRDFGPANVAAGRRLIAERGLDTVARFERGDAFDGDVLAGLDPQPTLAIVSGLYELFPENAPVRRSLDGLARAVPPGGYLLYTGQPWHPQLEFIARVLTSHRGGGAWVMRRRTQAELDQLVAAAGFRKIEQRIDRWGIFTVSLAQRVAA